MHYKDFDVLAGVVGGWVREDCGLPRAAFINVERRSIVVNHRILTLTKGRRTDVEVIHENCAPVSTHGGHSCTKIIYLCELLC